MLKYTNFKIQQYIFTIMSQWNIQLYSFAIFKRTLLITYLSYVYISYVLLFSFSYSLERLHLKMKWGRDVGVK